MLKEECGIVAVVDHPEAAQKCYLGLYALQHRGQEGAGIAALQKNGTIGVHKKAGLVNEVFRLRHFEKVPGNSAIGHVRYGTTGPSISENLQPLVLQGRFGSMAFAHNGNFPKADRLRKQLEREGAIFQTSSDTEIVGHLISRSTKTVFSEALVEALKIVEAAFSMVFINGDQVIAVRDPYGFRPLILGKLDRSYVVVSETCALDLMDARMVREIEPGEMILFSKGDMKSVKPFDSRPCHTCSFESIYFSRPDSLVFGQSVHEARISMGRALAREAPAKGADMVIPVPDSGVGAAIGFAREAGLPFEMGIIRNHYVHRTFISPEDEQRNLGVRIKLNPIRHLIDGRSLVVVDDSIVRGTTSQKIVRLLRDFGAREIHMRISSPPVTGPCFFGIDTPRKKDLIGSSKSVKEICEFIGADSLAYLSLAGMQRSVLGNELDAGQRLCDACFSGKYPMRTELPLDQLNQV